MKTGPRSSDFFTCFFLEPRSIVCLAHRTPIASRFDASEPLPSLYYRRGLNGLTHVLARPQRKGNGRFLTPQLFALDPNGQRVVVGYRDGGRDEVHVELIDIEHNTTITHDLPEPKRCRTALNVALSGYYYVERANTSCRLLYRSLFAPHATMELCSDLGAETPADIQIVCIAGDRFVIVVIRTASVHPSYYLLPIKEDSHLIPMWPGMSRRNGLPVSRRATVCVDRS